MKQQLTKEDKLIKQAYLAGGNAIVKSLGSAVTDDQIAHVVLHLVHSVLTANESLSIEVSRHNCSTFCDWLKELIETTQKDIHSNEHLGRLM